MSARVRRNNDGYAISCPGCGEDHYIGPSWGFNGDFERPTFSPSLLVRCGHYADPNHPCWCTHNAERVSNGQEESGFKCFRCHSFITDGKISFLSDCTHDLAGKEVDLPEVSI